MKGSGWKYCLTSFQPFQLKRLWIVCLLFFYLLIYPCWLMVKQNKQKSIFYEKYTDSGGKYLLKTRWFPLLKMINKLLGIYKTEYIWALPARSGNMMRGPEAASWKYYKILIWNKWYRTDIKFSKKEFKKNVYCLVIFRY